MWLRIRYFIREYYLKLVLSSVATTKGLIVITDKAVIKVAVLENVSDV